MGGACDGVRLWLRRHHAPRLPRSFRGADSDIPAAAEIASAAANIVVHKDGTAVCTAEELRDRFVGDQKQTDSVERLGVRLRLLKGEGKRIVFTNGCFDLIHRGHVTYLSQ